MPRQNNQSNSRRRRDPKAAAQGARHKHRRKLKRSEIEGQEIEQLEKQIKEQAPQSLAGGIPDEPNAQSYAQARDFEELPISKYTKRALAESNYVSLTAVQQACLPQALCGRDVLGAAKTGSGKTLSFLIPVCYFSLSCDSRAAFMFPPGMLPCHARLLVSKRLPTVHLEALGNLSTAVCTYLTVYAVS